MAFKSAPMSPTKKSDLYKIKSIYCNDPKDVGNIFVIANFIGLVPQIANFEQNVN